MSDSFFTKASAIVLTAAGVLGVGYGIAKYVTDFEAAKGEIQNLRGQIAQLHEVLSKVQFGADPARIERLEMQVNELGKAVTTLGDTFASAVSPGAAVVPSPASVPAVPAAHASIESRLRAGGFSGSATDGAETWPFRVADIRLGDGTSFEAVVEWTTLDSAHRITGDYSDERLFFKETDFIRKGKNHVLGCEYTLTSWQSDGIAGTFGNCDGNFSGGTVEVKWR